MVIIVLLSVFSEFLLRRMFRRRGKGFEIPSCHPGSKIPGVLPFLSGLHSRIQQIIKISPQNADHHTTTPVSAVQGTSPAFLPAPLLPFHPPFSLSPPWVPLQSHSTVRLSGLLASMCEPCALCAAVVNPKSMFQVAVLIRNVGRRQWWEDGRGLGIPTHNSSPAASRLCREGRRVVA